MIGAILIILILLAIPIAVFLTGAVVAVTLGQFLTRDVEAEYEGTEYVKLG